MALGQQDVARSDPASPTREGRSACTSGCRTENPPSAVELGSQISRKPFDNPVAPPSPIGLLDEHPTHLPIQPDQLWRSNRARRCWC